MKPKNLYLPTRTCTHTIHTCTTHTHTQYVRACLRSVRVLLDEGTNTTNIQITIIIYISPFCIPSGLIVPYTPPGRPLASSSSLCRRSYCCAKRSSHLSGSRCVRLEVFSRSDKGCLNR